MVKAKAKKPVLLSVDRCGSSYRGQFADAGYEVRDMLLKSKVGKLLRREIREGERRSIVKGEPAIQV